MRFSDQPPGGLLEIQHAGGRRLDAHLVFNGAHRHTVPVAGGAGIRGEILWHQEQGDPLGTARGIGELRQHEVHNVLGQVMVAGRDEDFRAGNPIGTIAVGHRFGVNHAEIGAGMRFGEAHRPAPGPVNQFREEPVLEGIRPVAQQGTDRAMGEPRVHAEGEIGGTEHLFHHKTDGFGEPLATIRRISRHARPSPGRVLRVRLLKAGWRAHLPLFMVHPLRIAALIDREQHLLADLGAFGEDGVNHIGCGLLKPGDRGQLRHVMDVVQEKPDIVEGGFVGGHERVSSGRENSNQDGISWKL